jgi:hypothetical protein
LIYVASMLLTKLIVLQKNKGAYSGK